MHQIPDSPIPCIAVSFAPNVPFMQMDSRPPYVTHLPATPGTPRSKYLLPPPALSPNQLLRAQRHNHLSPLSPPRPNGGKGLERARFEAMLKASKERSAMVGGKRPLELRKEIAVKVQRAKQIERRVLFLTKLTAPPSPSAADLPVTPPDSPAIFHFTLPSPGLESPLEHFETLLDHPELFENTKRVEQVDFRLPCKKQAEFARHCHSSAPTMNSTSSLPSLDQISQRLSQGAVTSATNAAPSAEHGLKGNSRLPSFLRSRSASVTVTREATPLANNQLPKRSRPVLPVLSLRAAAKLTGIADRTPTPITMNGPAFPAFPPTPEFPQGVELQMTTMVFPPTRSSSSPTEFSEKNISQFTSEQQEVVTRPTDSTVVDVHPAPDRRAQVTKDMFNKLSRRTPGLPGAAACGIKARDDILLAHTSSDPEGKVRRRISAPAELKANHRRAFHPVLEKPGGF